MNSTPQNPLEMSDEDFLKMNGPPAVESQEEEDEGAGDAAAEGEGDDGDNEDDNDDTGAADADAGEDDDDADPSDGDDGDEDDPDGKKADDASKDDTSGAEDGASDKSKSKSKANDKAESKDKPEAKATGDVDYKAFYDQIMTPFKANGRTIELKDPAEVIQLMQMGANYTKKLQDIQPHRKVLLMLQNNNLLDEGKLSYLIDLDKKNPEAIKKLVKDAGIDPMDIDTESEPDYTAGNHTVTEEESRFHEVLEEVSSTDTGKETITLINSTWDDASKEVIWNQPEVMTVIHEQRENGIYDQISTEVARQKTLGKIPHSTPFLQAYKAVGDAMAQAGAFGPVQTNGGNPGNPEPRKIAERVAKPKPKAANGDKAKAASTMRGSSGASKQPIVNPLAMSDEEFMKLDNLKNRL